MTLVALTLMILGYGLVYAGLKNVSMLNLLRSVLGP
jgi:hypothetical protein